MNHNVDTNSFSFTRIRARAITLYKTDANISFPYGSSKEKLDRPTNFKIDNSPCMCITSTSTSTNQPLEQREGGEEKVRGKKEEKRKKMWRRKKMSDTPKLNIYLCHCQSCSIRIIVTFSYRIYKVRLELF